MVKKLPSSLGDVGVIPGRGTKLPHAMEQLSPWAAARESVHGKERSHVPQLRPNAAK